MSGYETKQNQSSYSNFFDASDYESAKAEFNRYLNNGVETIILVGDGCNGKSHLLREVSESESGSLFLSEYEIMDGVFYVGGEEEILNKIYDLDKVKRKIFNKKIIKVINVQGKIINIITN